MRRFLDINTPLRNARSNHSTIIRLELLVVTHRGVFSIEYLRNQHPVKGVFMMKRHLLECKRTFSRKVCQGLCDQAAQIEIKLKQRSRMIMMKKMGIVLILVFAAISLNAGNIYSRKVHSIL